MACKNTRLKIYSFQELISSIKANFEKFNSSSFLKKVKSILLLIDGEIVAYNSYIDEKIKKATKIELIPIFSFSFVGTTLIFTSIAATTFAQGLGIFLVNTLVFTALSVGISFVISKLLSPKQADQVKTASYIFGNKENSAERNSPIPLNYGRLRIGSNIISSIIINQDIDSGDVSSKTPTITPIIENPRLIGAIR